MEEPVQIKFKVVYTFADVKHNHRYFSTRKFSGFKDKLYAFGAFGIGCFLVYVIYINSFYAPLPIGYYLLTIFFFALSVIFWFDLASLLGMWQGFRHDKGSEREYEFVIDASGVRYTLGGVQDVKFAWSQFKDVRESSESFFLVLERETVWGLPKRFFTPDEMRAFRDLVNRHVENARL